MEHIHPTAFCGKSPLIGRYIYSRQMTRYGYSVIRDFARIDAQISPSLFVIANVHIVDDIMISRRIMSIDEMRACTIHETHDDLRACWEWHVHKVIEAGLRRRAARKMI